MKFIEPGQPFSFCYQAFDQVTDLFVQARVYDVSTGTPVLLDTVIMQSAGIGLYTGSYPAQSLTSYLVIALVYTSDLYTVIDTNRAPWAECYKSTDAPTSFMLFNYGAFDQYTGMDVAANIFDITTGDPVFVTQTPMSEVYAGVYFGSSNGNVPHCYAVNTSVYTDGTYTVVDTDRPSGSDVFELLEPGVIFNFTPELILTGQSTYGILEGQC